jgi:Methyltransferase domain
LPNPFNTDKITPHGYFQTYARIAGELGPDAAVCEIGVLNGEGLRMFQALFPLAAIWGVDHNDGAGWPDGTIRVVSLQDSEDLPGKLEGPFGLIVDDASHEEGPTIRTFGMLWPLVRPGGYYVVEDWTVGLVEPHQWGPGMLKAAQSFLPLLGDKDGDVESVTYRYGMILVKKRAASG